MKQRTNAIITGLSIDHIEQPVLGKPVAELEFSAVDTGGGFHHPILDFVYSAELKNPIDINSEQQYQIKLSLRDPQNTNNRSTLSCRGSLRRAGPNRIEGGGRLHEDQISNEMMTFILKRLR